MAVGEQNWVRYTSNAEWVEVPVTEVYRDTILEKLLKDWLEEMVSEIIEEAESS